MEFHFRRHFRLRPKMKNAFSVGLYIKPFRITPYVNDFQTLNNPGSRQPAGASINEFCPAFWHKSFILHHHHHHRRSVVRVNRCAAPWPLTISDLHGVDRSKRWHPPESCWARRFEDDPAVFSSFAIGFLPSYLSTIRRRASCADTPGSRRATWPNRDKRRWRKMSPMVDKPDRWNTSALETWNHQHTSSICCWPLIWQASSVFMSVTKRVYVSVP